MRRAGTQRVDGVRRLETDGRRLRQIGRRRPDIVVHGPEGDAADRVRLRAVSEGVDGLEWPALQSDVSTELTATNATTRSCYRREYSFRVFFFKKKKLNIINTYR